MFYTVAYTFLRAFESLLWNLIHHKIRLYILCVYLLHVDVHYIYKKWVYICDSVDMLVCVLSHFSRVRLSATPWTTACQAPLSMGFSRQEYWNGLPFPSPVMKYEVSEVNEVKLPSHVRLFATPWPVAYQAPPSMGFFQARVLEWGAIAFSRFVFKCL